MKCATLLVKNQCVNDSRVIRTAETLHESGLGVIVLAKHSKSIPIISNLNGVIYIRCGGENSGFSSEIGGCLEKLISLYRDATDTGAKIFKFFAKQTYQGELAPQEAFLALQYWSSRIEKLPTELKKYFVLQQGQAGKPTKKTNPKPIKKPAPIKKPESKKLRLKKLALRISLIKYFYRKFRAVLYRLGMLTIVEEKLINASQRGGKKNNMVAAPTQDANHFFFLEHINFSSLDRVDTDFLFVLKELKPDIVHANELNTLSSAVLYKKLCLETPKVIYDSHEFESGRVMLKDEAERQAVIRHEKLLVNQVDHVITVSNILADLLKSLHNIDRPSVIYNTPEASKSTSRATVRQQLGLSPEVPLGVYVGRYKLGRGQEIILEAVKHAPNVHLVFVGFQPPQVLEQLRSMAYEHKISGRVHFLPPVLPSEVTAYIKDADFGVIPTQNIGESHRFAMPNKLFEMSLAGLPLIGGENLDEIANYIRSNKIGLTVDETDPRSFAQAYLKICSDISEYKPDQAALEMLVTNYGWESQVNILRQVYGLQDNVENFESR